MLNLAIPRNSCIALFCSFSALLNSFSEIFCILALFSSFSFNNFLWLLFILRLLSYLLRIFNNSSVDRFWSSWIPLFFVIRLYYFLVSSIFFDAIFYIIQSQKKEIFIKELIILITTIYMQWLCILLYTLMHNFRWIYCDYLCVFISARDFLFGVNVYVFIPMVLFIIKHVYA